MFPHYNVTLNSDGSYSFITDAHYQYTIYFLEYRLKDSDSNTHIVANFTFFRNGEFINIPFLHKYDSKISLTIIQIVNDFFSKNEDKALLYFCSNDDGYGRHRNIILKKWADSLLNSLECHYKSIQTISDKFEVAFIVLHNNPLKALIINAFENDINELLELLK